MKVRGCSNQYYLTRIVMINLNDAVTVRYLIGWIVAAYGAGLFGWWWFRNRGASFIFMCITILFAGDLVEKTIQIYGRQLRLLTGSVAFSESSFLWVWKGDISTLMSFIVCLYLTLRAAGFIRPPSAWYRCSHCGEWMGPGAPPLKRNGRRKDDIIQVK